ncbi:hypothetical protein Tco_0571854 [Tanacetum coccineum]
MMMMMLLYILLMLKMKMLDDEDEEDDGAPHPNLINWNWDEIIVIPSDDEADEKEVDTQVSVIGRKRVYALIDENDNDEEY